MFDARIIANEILKRAWERNLKLAHSDIQKITYFLHGHHLKDYGVPLVDSEFEAWDSGPVQSKLYNAFGESGDKPVDQLAMKFNPVKRTYSELPPLEDADAKVTIDKYLTRYLEIPGHALADMTHEAGTPWSETIERARDYVNIGMRISNDLIRSDFEGVSEPASFS